MATRASIVFTWNSEKVIMYHHCDGYYEYLGKLLERYIETYSCDSAIKFCRILNELDESFEYTDHIHSDVSYVYYINLENNTIKMYNNKNELIKDVEVF